MDSTEEIVKKFEALCGEYALEDIDADKLKKEVIDVIENYSQ